MTPSSRWRVVHVMVVALAGLVFGWLYLAHPGFQSFIHNASGKLVSGEVEAFRDYLLSFGVLAPVVSASLMIFVLVVAPPLPAFVITFANGLLFGTLWGSLLSWASAMVGAGLSFYIARALGRPAIEVAFPPTSLDWVDRFFERYGIHSVLIARLVPVISFALISFASGLTAMRFTGYIVATGVGQLPATALYSWLGQNASSSILYVFWAFVVVACMAVVAWALEPSIRARIGRAS